MDFLFSKLANGAGGIIPHTAKSIRWFKEMVAKTTTTPNKLLAAKENIQVRRIDRTSIGTMCFYFYDPKHKETLSYYDKFPVIFVTDIYPDGWGGINLHYLPPVLRAKLMEALYQTTINKNNDENTKLKISYKILKSLSNAKYFKPCYKRYLFSHVASKIMMVKSQNWDMVAFLPIQRFAKQTAKQVWDESRNEL